MLVQDGCSACDEAKEILKDDIKQKRIILFDITSKEGSELAEKHNIETVPTIINEKDKFQRKCYISEDYSKMLCENGEVKELIKKKEEI